MDNFDPVRISIMLSSFSVSDSLDEIAFDKVCNLLDIVRFDIPSVVRAGFLACWKMLLGSSMYRYVVCATGISCYSPAIRPTVFDWWWPARPQQDIVDLMYSSVVTGAPYQQMLSYVLRASFGDNQSFRINKRDWTVSYHPPRPNLYLRDECAHLLVPCGRFNFLQLVKCRILGYG